MSHAATKNDTHGAHTASTATPKAGAKAAAPKDAAADAQKLLLLLAADWLNNDRTHQAEIGEGATSATMAVTPEDSGHSGACVVTATNAHGDTTAPMSNAVVVA